MPDFRIKPDDYTALMEADAEVLPGLKPFQAGAHGKFQVTGWTRPEPTLTWEISVPQGDAHAVNRLLHNFRVNAGLPAPATPCGGWEAPGCGLRGHFTGHYLSACAMMFAATGDPVFQERVAQLVDGLAKCQQALGDGYLSAPGVELPELGFTLAQESDFPAGGTIRIRLEAAIPFEAALRFRLPPWLAGPAEARINGAAAPDPNATRDGSWLMLDRTWQPGDRIELSLPMNVRVRAAMDDPALVSFFHGPVLLAGALGREAMPESDIVFNQTAFHELPPIGVPLLQSVSPDALKPVNGRPLT